MQRAQALLDELLAGSGPQEIAATDSGSQANCRADRVQHGDVEEVAQIRYLWERAKKYHRSSGDPGSAGLKRFPAPALDDFDEKKADRPGREANCQIIRVQDGKAEQL